MEPKRLKNHYVAYIDVLGFKNFGMSNPEVLTRYSNALTAALSTLDDYVTERNGAARPFVKIFTDNIVLARPVESEDGETELACLMEDVAAFQWQLLIRGFFLRGGLSLGKLYIDENIVYGPGLVEAYVGESKRAKYPRVVLCDSVVAKTTSFETYYSDPADVPHYMGISFSQRPAFIDYLSMLIEDPGLASRVLPKGGTVVVEETVGSGCETKVVPTTYEGVWEVGSCDVDEAGTLVSIDVAKPVETLLMIHREMAVAHQGHSDERISSKYRWVANYHNVAIKALSSHESRSSAVSELLIPEELIVWPAKDSDGWPIKDSDIPF